MKTLPENPDRRRFIGGSDAAAILGLSSFRTTYDVYVSKTAETPEEMDPAKKKFLERRRRWEPVVVQMLKEDLDAKIVATNKRYIDPAIDYFASELDAEAEDNGETLNVEIKTVHPRAYGEKFGWGEGGTGEVPIDYEAQVQWGLGLTGRKRAVLVAMVGLDDMVFYPIERDNEGIAKMRAACQKFWTENVLKKVAPDPQTVADLAKMFKTPTVDLAVAASDDIGSKALRLRAIDANMKALELEFEALEFDVKRALGNAEYLTVDGRKVYSWKLQNWSRLDQEGLKEKEKAIYKQYMKTGKHRVFKALTSY